MGYNNVAAVYTHWGHLSDRDARLLAWLALIAKDTDAPPRYWGGWAHAAESGLGRREFNEPARQAVKRAFRSLVASGALVSSHSAVPGRTSEYALTLDPATTARVVGATVGSTGYPQMIWEEVPRGSAAAVDNVGQSGTLRDA